MFFKMYMFEVTSSAIMSISEMFLYTFYIALSQSLYENIL